MDKRLIITISFKGDKEAYEYVKSQPNASYFIRKLVREEMDKKSNPSIVDSVEFKDILNW